MSSTPSIFPTRPRHAVTSVLHGLHQICAILIKTMLSPSCSSFPSLLRRRTIHLHNPRSRKMILLLHLHNSRLWSFCIPSISRIVAFRLRLCILWRRCLTLISLNISVVIRRVHLLLRGLELRLLLLNRRLHNRSPILLPFPLSRTP